MLHSKQAIFMLAMSAENDKRFGCYGLKWPLPLAISFVVVKDEEPHYV